MTKAEKREVDKITAYGQELGADYMARGLSGLTSWLCDVLYPYLNDDHIQTALNKIVKPL